MHSLTGAAGCLELDCPDGVNGVTAEGVFYACALDGLENGMQWYRVAIEQEIPRDSYIKVSLYASDAKAVFFRNTFEPLDHLILSDKISAGDKKNLLDPLFEETFTNTADALVSVKGRYLWIRIELRGTAVSGPKLKKLRVFMPGENVVDYLPEIYRIKNEKSDFFFRYMSLFQTFIFDLEQKIDNVSCNFDVEVAEKDFLDWLCKWLDIRDIHSWEESRLRLFLSEAMEIYAAAGTRKGVERLVEIFTGEKPFLIEYSQVKAIIGANIPDNPYKRIYGENPYRFFVLISEECLSGTKKLEALLKLLKDNIPAQTEAVVVPLKPYIYLDMHTYIGVNSCIGEQTPLVLEKNMSMPFNTLLSNIE